jgi:uncharacterized protein YndB with AHSA1/START domain
MPSTKINAIEREIKINARPETVFSYLVDEHKLRKWMSMSGAWNPRPGTPYRIAMTKEDTAVGSFVDVQAPKRLVFTWGWDGDDAVTKPGSTTIEIDVIPDGAGSIVRFLHRDLPTQESAERHSHGWDHYLGRLAIAATGADPGPDEFQD